MCTFKKALGFIKEVNSIIWLMLLLAVLRGLAMLWVIRLLDHGCLKVIS